MVKVTLKRTAVQEYEAEVIFPIYRTYGDDFDGRGFYDAYNRITRDGIVTHILKRSINGRLEWEFSSYKINIETSLDDYLGPFSSDDTEASFNAVMSELAAATAIAENSKFTEREER